MKIPTKATSMLGVLALWVLAVLGPLKASNAVGLVSEAALVLLSLAAILTIFQLRGKRHTDLPVHDAIQKKNFDSRINWHKSSAIALLVSAVIPAIAIQSWFRAGTILAFGDMPPLAGTASFAHLFQHWTWNGAGLGAPGENELQLPWVLWTTLLHHLGANTSISQRIWFTLIFVSVSVGAATLMTVLDFGAVSTIAAGVSYSLTPYLFAPGKALNPEYLVAMALIPLCLSWTINVGRRSQLRGIDFIVPFIFCAGIGYIFELPPLALPALVAILTGPFFAGWLFGPTVFRRSLRRTVLAGLTSLALSAYWVVPYLVSLRYSIIPATTASQLASWIPTEARAHLESIFWLCTTPLWNHIPYFPYSTSYKRIPLSFLKYLLPIAAFGSLFLVRIPRSFRSARSARTLVLAKISAAGSISALVVIFIANGTNFPASSVYRLIYTIPYGLLFQQPTRFLMIVALAYALLVGVSIEIIIGLYDNGRILDINSVISTRIIRQVERLMHAHKLGNRSIRTRSIASLIVLLSIVSLDLTVNFPIVNGLVVAKGMPTGIPSKFVKVPSYWKHTASYLNSVPGSGPVLILPIVKGPFVSEWQDTSWYYGSIDGFLESEIRRPTISPTNYFASSYPTLGGRRALLQLINSIEASISQGDWNVASSLVRSLGVKYILVRGDITEPALYTSLEWPTPVFLRHQLSRDPNVKLTYSAGPLAVFKLTSEAPKPNYVVVDKTSVPWVSGIAEVRGNKYNTYVVNRGPSQLPSLVPVPNFSKWTWSKNSRNVTVGVSISSRTELAVGIVPVQAGSPVVNLQTLKSDGPTSLGDGTTVQLKQLEANQTASIVLPTYNAISDGNFSARPDGGLSSNWSSVSNCAESVGSAGISGLIRLGATGSGSSLQLSSISGLSCVRQNINVRPGMNEGGLKIRMLVRHLYGSAPSGCIEQLGECIHLSMPSNNSWTSWSTTIPFSSRNGPLSLYLYSGTSGKVPSANEYSNITVRTASGVPVILTQPTYGASKTNVALTVSPTSFSRAWVGPPEASHVVVDGVMNGWISFGISSSRTAFVRYSPNLVLYSADLFTMVLTLLVILLYITLLGKRKRPKQKELLCRLARY